VPVRVDEPNGWAVLSAVKLPVAIFAVKSPCDVEVVKMPLLTEPLEKAKFNVELLSSVPFAGVVACFSRPFIVDEIDNPEFDDAVD